MCAADQLDFVAAVPLRAQLVMALDRVEAEPDPILVPVLLSEQVGGELGALADVDPAVRSRVIQADVVEQAGDQQHLAIDLQLPCRGESVGDQEDAEPVTLHWPAALAGRLAKSRERCGLGFGPSQILCRRHGDPAGWLPGSGTWAPRK